MNLRKKVTDAFYFGKHEKRHPKVALAAFAGIGLLWGCALASPTTNYSLTSKPEPSVIVEEHTKQLSIEDVDLSEKLKYLVPEEVTPSPSAQETPKPVIHKKSTSAIVPKQHKPFTNHSTVSASGGMNTNNSMTTPSATAVPLNTIIDKSQLNADNATGSYAVWVHMTMANMMSDKIDDLQDTVDSLTDENEKLAEELNKYKQKELAEQRAAEEKKKQERAEEERKEKEERENKITPLHLNANYITELSGADVKTLNALLKNTYLEGYGELYYNLEKKYGVNALFSIGNSILETGWDGDSYLARTKNNIYGLNTSRTFGSKKECIEYWFDLISRCYVGQGLTSMSSINKKYCPPNSLWSSDIQTIIKKLITKKGLTLN